MSHSCEHKPLDHSYDTTARANTGPCLVRGCGCHQEPHETPMFNMGEES